ncbi:ATP synthase delta chain mitochondrial precursor [Alternaria alternata]|nr:ATP synthase delta chain mitochondrial precursor [Alternaria alternata]
MIASVSSVAQARVCCGEWSGMSRGCLPASGRIRAQTPSISKFRSFGLKAQPPSPSSLAATVNRSIAPPKQVTMPLLGRKFPAQIGMLACTTQRVESEARKDG